MTALANESKYDVRFLTYPALFGFMAVSIGASGAPTIVGPVANMTITRASAGAYDFSSPTLPAGSSIFVLPFSLITSTVVGFQGDSGGTRVKTLVESGGTIAVNDPGNGDLLLFLVFIVGPNVGAV